MSGVRWVLYQHDDLYDIARNGRQVVSDLDRVAMARYLLTHSSPGDSFFREEKDGYRTRMSDRELKRDKRR